MTSTVIFYLIGLALGYFLGRAAPRWPQYNAQEIKEIDEIIDGINRARRELNNAGK